MDTPKVIKWLDEHGFTREAARVTDVTALAPVEEPKAEAEAQPAKKATKKA